MSLGSHFDRTLSAFSRFIGEKLSKGDQGAVGVVSALTVGALAGGYLLLPSFDRKTLPKVTKGPELQDAPPYAHDVLPGGAWVETPLGRIR